MLDPLMHSLTVNSELDLKTGYSLSSWVRRVVTGVLSSASNVTIDLRPSLVHLPI